jgi:sugar/nucleoside kinase (ribokinase family)
VHRAYSPNAEEALSLLADSSPVSKSSIERAGKSFLDFGVGPAGTGTVIIRSGTLGAFVTSREQPGVWIEAYWRTGEKVVDVTGDYLFPPHGQRPDTGLSTHHASVFRNQGAGNSFLGGFAAGLALTNGDVVEGKLLASGTKHKKTPLTRAPTRSAISCALRNDLGVIHCRTAWLASDHPGVERREE